MGEVLPLPNRGDVFADLRGEGRTLRVSWHSDERTIVLSIWHLGQCRSTFRLPADQVPDLVRSLVVAGLGDSCELPAGGSPVAVHPTALSNATPEALSNDTPDADEATAPAAALEPAAEPERENADPAGPAAAPTVLPAPPDEQA